MTNFNILKTALIMTALLLSVTLGSFVVGILLQQSYVVAFAGSCTGLAFVPGLIGNDIPLLWKNSVQEVNRSMILCGLIWIPFLLLIVPAATAVGVVQLAALWLGYQRAWKKNASYRATVTQVTPADFLARKRPF
jgi:hypothetical protein